MVKALASAFEKNSNGKKDAERKDAWETEGMGNSASPNPKLLAM